MAATAVTRFRRSRPCPICGGGDDMPRGKGQRCSGYLSSDERFAYCTREEHSGFAPLEQTDPPSYRHILEGECRCGITHAPARAEEMIATYDYVDADGTLLFQVVRQAGKRFLQRRPDGSGGWIWKLEDTRRVLYRLPAVLAAAAAAETVYVVEGEKDVHAVENAGAVATCNPGGAGKWRSEYADALAGAEVIVVADKDEPGLAHARQVAATLPAARTTVVKAAAGKDVHDHLASGKTLAELEPLDSPAPRADPTVTLAEFVARKPDVDVQPLITCGQGTIAPAGALVLNGGKASAGKTTWILDLILHAAAGNDYCGLSFPRPLRILVIENEGPREGFREKLEERLPHGPNGGEQVRIWDDEALWGMIRVSEDELRAQLRDITAEHRIDIVVSDSLTRFGMSGNGTPEETRDFMLLLADAGLGRDVAFLILAHTRTRVDNEADELEQLAGAWAPHADAILMLRKLGGNRARLSYPKTRWTRGVVPSSILSFEASTERFTLVHTEAEDADAITDDTYEDRVVEYLKSKPWATTSELENGVKGKAVEVRSARDRLKAAGRVTSSPSRDVGRVGTAKRWNLVTEPNQHVPIPGTDEDEMVGSSVTSHADRPSVPPREGTDLRDGSGIEDHNGHRDDPIGDDELERLADLARHAEANGTEAPSLDDELDWSNS